MLEELIVFGALAVIAIALQKGNVNPRLISHYLDIKEVGMEPATLINEAQTMSSSLKRHVHPNVTPSVPWYKVQNQAIDNIRDDVLSYADPYNQGETGLYIGPFGTGNRYFDPVYREA